MLWAAALKITPNHVLAQPVFSHVAGSLLAVAARLTG
jgi:hypothetical protein